LNTRACPDSRTDPGDQLIQQEVIRNFAPGALDLDDLTEAIRQLIAPTRALEMEGGFRSASDLLLPRHRGTHVVGADTP
jgi:hypothetical protein